MGKLTGIDRTAHFAWSPPNHNSILFAAGSSATSSSLDASSDAGKLEIYQFNPADSGKPALRGSVELEQKIFKLAWSPLTSTYGQQSAPGVLVTGIENGITIYSVEKILQNHSDAVIMQSKKHSGAVHALDISPSLPNLLASGAADSEVFVWDLNTMDHCVPAGPKSFPLDDVTSVSWNRRISYIFASTFATRCVLWDLRKSDSIIKLGDQNSRIRYKALDWNPILATQLALASQDDHEPVIQLWDLRNGSAPFKCLEGHQRGVLSISWCPHDSDILLSAGKDGNVYAWNVNEASPAEIIFSLPPSRQWAFEVSWCPRTPSLFSACYYEDKLDICTVMGDQKDSQAPEMHSKLLDSFPGMNISPVRHPSANLVASSIRKAPKWLRRPGACAFSVDGKLLRTVSEDGVIGLEISRPVYNQDFVDRATVLEKHLNSYQEREYCDLKLVEEDSATEREEWNFIKACFQPDSLLPLLGYHTEIPVRPAHENGQFSKESSPDSGLSSFRIRTGKDVEGTITRALLAGKLDQAVDLCLRHQRETEAVMLSLTKFSGHLPELFRQTQDLFFASRNSNLSQLIRAIVKKDMQFLIEQCQPENWRKVVAVLLNYGDSKELATLMMLLGDRLQNEPGSANRHSSVICYICAGNIDKMVEVWMQGNPKNSDEAAALLQSTTEKTLIAIRAFGNTGIQSTFGSRTTDLFHDYALYLTEQGELGMALRFLNQHNLNGLNKLKHRLYTALGSRRALAEANMHASPLSVAKDVRRASQPASSWSPVFKGHQSFEPVGFQPTFAHSSLGTPYSQPFTPVRAAEDRSHGAQAPLASRNSSGWSPIHFQGQPEITSVIRPPAPSPYTSGHYQPTLPEPRASATPSASFPFYDPTSFVQPAPSLANSFDQPPRQTSYQNIKPAGGWNDPPPLLFTNRRPSNPPVMAPSATTAPLPSIPGMAPDGLSGQPMVPHQGPPFSLQHHVPHTAPFQNVTPAVYPGSAQTPTNVQPVSEPVKEKLPISPDVVPISQGLHQVLDHFRETAINGGDAHTIRRLDDVAKKLEALDDCLRNRTLSEAVLSQLHLIVHNLQTGDPSQALNIHAHLASQGLFTEVGSFLPGVKVLLQLCQRAPG